MKKAIIYLLVILGLVLGVCVQKACSQTIEVGVNYSANYNIEGHISVALAYNRPHWGGYVKTYPHEQWPLGETTETDFTTETAFLVGGTRTFLDAIQLNAGVGKYRNNRHYADDTWDVEKKIAYEFGLSIKVIETQAILLRVQGNFTQTKNLMMYSGIAFGLKLNYFK